MGQFLANASYVIKPKPFPKRIIPIRGECSNWEKKEVNTKTRLLEIVDECNTQKEAATKLGVSKQYISTLSRRYGISKWRQKNRIYKPVLIKRKICEECDEEFSYFPSKQSPARFCSKKCQGKWLGKNYGFKRKNLGWLGGSLQ